MTLDEAIKLREQNVHLIGKMFEGNIIDDIIIIPTSQTLYKAFLKEYLNIYNWKVVKAFIDTNYSVIACLELKQYVKHGIFLYRNIDAVIKWFQKNKVDS